VKNKENRLDINSNTPIVLMTGVFLVSFSLLAFEVALIRLMSVMLTYHYVFAAVSLSLFGLGIGSVFVLNTLDTRNAILLGIYKELKNVEIVVGEGRSCLKESKEKYDIIMFSLPVTNSSRSFDGYALIENFLFTTEAINDYLEHLTEEGRLIVVTHNDLELLRLLSKSLSALNKMGVGSMEAMKQVYILGSDDYPTFILKKTRFESAGILARYNAAIHQFGYNPLFSFFPYNKQPGVLNPVLASLETGQRSLSDVVNMVKERGYDISPVTDHSPFFYKLNIGIPGTVFLVFCLSVILMLAVVLGPLLYRLNRWKGGSRGIKGLYDKTVRNQVCFLCIFSMTGIGFMLVEITLIQRFMLFFGQPVLSTTVVLFSLLVGAGLGSLRSNRLTPDSLSGGITRSALGNPSVKSRWS